MEMIKELFSLFGKNPANFICVLCMAGIGIVYNDARSFIISQQEVLNKISETQVQMQVEMHEFNIRLGQLEHQKDSQ